MEYEEPFERPEMTVEWMVAFVEEKEPVMREYMTFGVVEYLQAAVLSVDTMRVAWVVPEESVPVGEPPESVGGVVSEGSEERVVADEGDDWADAFPAASYADTVYVYRVEGARPVSEYEVPVVVFRDAPFLYMRYPVTPVASVEAVQERFTWEEEMEVARRLAGIVGARVSAGALYMVTEMVEVARFPAASRATAESWYVPFAMLTVLQEPEYGDEVSSEPMRAFPSLNWTPETPTLSEAVAERVTVPESVELFAGDVREMVGGRVSEEGG